MKTIEIDIDKTLNKDELMEIFQLNNLSKGDEIKLISDDSEFAKKFMILFAITLIVIIFFRITKKSSSDKTDALIKGIFDKYESDEELQEEIESELGIKYEFEKKKPKHNAIDELFGKWENSNIDLKQIREKSWARRK